MEKMYELRNIEGEMFGVKFYAQGYLTDGQMVESVMKAKEQFVSNLKD